MLVVGSLSRFLVLAVSVSLMLLCPEMPALAQNSLTSLSSPALIALLNKELRETTPALSQSMTAAQLKQRALLMQAIAREIQSRLKAQGKNPEQNSNFRNARDRFNQLKARLKAAISANRAAPPQTTPTPRPTPTPAAELSPNIKLASRYKQTHCCPGDRPVTTTMLFSLNENGDYTFSERLADGTVTREGIATTSNDNVWIEWDKNPHEDGYLSRAIYQIKDGKLSLVDGSVRDPRGFNMENCQSTLESEKSASVPIPNAAIGAGFLVLADPSGKDVLQLEGAPQIVLGDHSGREAGVYHPDKSGKMTGDGSFTCRGPASYEANKKVDVVERQIMMTPPPSVIKEKQAITLATSLSSGAGPKASGGWIVDGFDPSGKLAEVSVDAYQFSGLAKIRPVLSSPKFTITFGCYCNGATSWIKWTYKPIASSLPTSAPSVVPPRIPALKAEGPFDNDIAESDVFGAARPRIQPNSQGGVRTSTLGTPSRYQRQEAPPVSPPRGLPPVTSSAAQSSLSGVWIASYVNLLNNNRGTYPPMRMEQSGNQVSFVLPGEGPNEAFRGVMNGDNVQLQHNRVQANGFKNERYMILNRRGADTLEGELESRQTTPWGKSSITRFRYSFQRQSP